MKSIIVIPARYGSTRFPGKPLAEIAGQTMLSRVVQIAHSACQNRPQTTYVVATDDQKIADHCDDMNASWVMTPTDCPTGTDRCLTAVDALAAKDPQWANPDFVVSLQGDAPLTPPDFVTALLEAFDHDPQLDVVTPVTQLTWPQLDTLREQKKNTPFSGTTAILNNKDEAIWFSKQIIPAIRKEEKHRETMDKSPIFRHIGLYGYRYDRLKEYVTLSETLYEKLEGLEQLRALENGFRMKCVKVDYKDRAAMSGVDSPEDVARAEDLIAQHGELL